MPDFATEGMELQPTAGAHDKKEQPMHTKRLSLRSTRPYRIRLAMLAGLLLLLPVGSAFADPPAPKVPSAPTPPHFRIIDGHKNAVSEALTMQDAASGPRALKRVGFGPNPARHLAGSTEQISTTSDILLYDGFESAPWPYFDTLWSRFYGDNERYWDDVSYNSNSDYGGAWSGWPAAGGTDGKIPVPGDDKYPNNTATWMIYGPVDLSVAEHAYWVFSVWREIEQGDFAFFGVSTNGINFSGYFYQAGNNSDWTYDGITLDDLIGQNQVWVGWYFESDGSKTARGPYIDDVFIWREIALAPTSSRVSVPVAGFSPVVVAADPCASYEPNDNSAQAAAFGASGSTLTSTVCAEGSDDYYYFNVGQAGNVQITLNLPQPLYKEWTLSLFKQTDRGLSEVQACTNAPPLRGRSGTTKPIVATCSVTPGKHYLRLDGPTGTSDPNNQYSVQINYP